jgi:hypothetical protein
MLIFIKAEVQKTILVQGLLLLIDKSITINPFIKNPKGSQNHVPQNNIHQTR